MLPRLSVILLLCIFLPSLVHASTTLKRVELKNPSQVDLVFDRNVSLRQIKTEFFNDVIQLSMSDVSVYPAKIFSAPGKDLSKVFAYQYSPKLVRCRLTVRGKAVQFEHRITLKPQGKVLSIHFGEGVSDRIAQSAAAPVSESPNEMKMDTDERQLLDRVLKKPTTAQPILVADAPVLNKESKPKHFLTSAKPLPNIFKSIGMLMLVLVLFGCCAFAAIRFKGRGSKLDLAKSASKIMSQLSKFNLSKKENMIEVVANHYLGPKKNIVVVRVAENLLVLGVSNDSISLITQLTDSTSQDFGLETIGISEASALASKTVNAQGAGAIAAGNPVFFEMLNSERTKPSIRSQIRSRVEQMKPL